MRHCLIPFCVVFTLLLATCKKDSAELNFDLSAPMESLPLDSIVIGFCCNGGESVQKGKIPGNVSSQFDNDFPGAYLEEWYFFNGVYGVRFEIDYLAYKAIYMVGDENEIYLLAYIAHLQKSEIPPTVEAAVKERYGSAWVINSAFEVETIYHIYYELIIDKEGDEIKVFFNENGGFLSSCSP